MANAIIKLLSIYVTFLSLGEFMRRYLALLTVLLLFAEVVSQSNLYGQEELVAVGINGAKITSGTYRVSPDQRVLDVIKMAYDGIIPPLDTIDSRHIILQSGSGPEDTLDLLRYLATGDKSQNPYVTGGQSIRIGFATEWVYVSGDLQGVLVGNVPLRRDESAADLLELYTLNVTADTNQINYERVSDSTVQYGLSELSDVILNNLDGISIFPVKERTDIYRVTIIGEVERPGIYSIEHGVTSAYSLIQQSGGATDIGNIDESWLIRKGKRDRLPEEQLIEGMESVKREITYSVSNGVISGDFLIIPLKDGDLPLEDGDEIVIPKIERLVYVSGLVLRPGGYPYVEGENIEFYIGAAGGFTNEADDNGVRVVETYGDVYRTVVNETISAGDLILVPEKDKERRTRFVLAIITSIASVLTSLVTLAAFAQTQTD